MEFFIHYYYYLAYIVLYILNVVINTIAVGRMQIVSKIFVQLGFFIHLDLRRSIIDDFFDSQLASA